MKRFTINLLFLLFILLVLTGFIISHKDAAKSDIPFSQALDNAAIQQKTIPDVFENSLLIGNGDINGLVTISNGKLIIRLSKNDIGDWRYDTSKDSSGIPWTEIRKKGEAGNFKVTNTSSGWSEHANPCPIPCGRIVLDLGENVPAENVILDIHRAVVKVGDKSNPAATVRCLYNSNVFLIEGGTNGKLLSHEVSYLHSAESGSGDGVSTLFQDLPAGNEWPGMSYAVAMASENNRTAVAVVSGFDDPSPLEKAVNLAKTTLKTKNEKLVSEHEASWNSFWSKSGIWLDDKYLTDTWYRNLYFLRTVSRPGVSTVGLFAGLVSDGSPAWHAAHTLNYNTEQAFWSAYACNHLELAESYRWLINRYWKNANWLCKQLFGFEGMYFPHNIFTYQIDHASSKQHGNGVHIFFPWSYSLGLTGWVMQNIWWEYEYGGRDEIFLKERVYPMLKDAALFYTNFINTCQKLPGGKVKFGPGVSPEHYGFSPDLSKNWDETNALVYSRFALETAIESAERLKVDSVLTIRFKNALKMLPDYPCYGEGNEMVVVNVKDEKPMVCNVPDPVFPVFPGEQVTWFSPGKEKDLLARTITTLKSNGNNDIMILCLARARLSLPDTYEYIVRGFRNRQRENGLLNLNVNGSKFNPYGNYSEMFAASEVVSELLLQSVANIIRVFPAWPASKDGRFENLCAKGGFLVSSQLKEGKILSVVIKSTAGGNLCLLNPWKTAKLKVSINSKPSRTIEQDAEGKINLSTLKDDMVVIQPLL